MPYQYIILNTALAIKQNKITKKALIRVPQPKEQFEILKNYLKCVIPVVSVLNIIITEV